MVMVRKQETFEARQFTDLASGAELAEWTGGLFRLLENRPDGTWHGVPYGMLKVNPNGGEQGVRAGDWVVSFGGNYRTYQPAEYAATFEEVT